MSSSTINPDVGLFFPPVMMGVRDLNVFQLFGEYKFDGAISGPLFPSNGIPLLVASIGNDGGRSAVSSNAAGSGQGVTGTSNSLRVGTIAASVVGATTVTYTVTSGGAPVVGDIFQIDANVVATPTTAECRKVTAVSGAGPYTLTLDSGLNFSHTASAAAITVLAPFSHSLVQSNSLDSLTIEKNVGGFQSEQYTGCRVNKYQLKLATGNTEAQIQADIMGQNVTILDAPSTVSIINESPFVFAEATLTYLGNQINVPTSITVDIENGLKPTYTFAQSHSPGYITPVTRKISGQMSLVFSSLDDVTYGYFKQVTTQETGNLSLQLVHPSAAGSGGVTISLNKINLSKSTDDIKMADVVLVQLDWEARLDLSASPVNTIAATVADTQYDPW